MAPPLSSPPAPHNSPHLVLVTPGPSHPPPVLGLLCCRSPHLKLLGLTCSQLMLVSSLNHAGSMTEVSQEYLSFQFQGQQTRTTEKKKKKVLLSSLVPLLIVSTWEQLPSRFLMSHAQAPLMGHTAHSLTKTYIYINLAVPQGMWDLSSLTGDQSLSPCIGKLES